MWRKLGIAWVGWMVLALCGCTDEIVPVCGEGTELVAGECLPVEMDGSAGNGGQGEAGPGSRCGPHTVELDAACHGLLPVGAACEFGRQCASGTCLPDDRGLPGGYCTVLSCNENRPCPAGSICEFSSSQGRAVCLAFCDDAEDCRDGYVCQSLFTTDSRVCAPDCTHADNCRSPTRCDEESGQCVLDECDPEPHAICDADGGACDAGADAGCVSDAGMDAAACAPPLTCDEDELCRQDTRGLSSTGGLCLQRCEPDTSDGEMDDAGVAEPQCAFGQVCQPLPDDPAQGGICVLPVCEQNADCPAGATCVDGVCAPPPRCDEEGACANTERVCVGGAGGRCLPRCPEQEGEACSDIHPDLRCEPTREACAPLGSFPGSACRTDAETPCDPVSLGSGSEAPMVCRDARCLVDCSQGENALCAGVSETLTCAEGVYDMPVCLPAGTVPGEPCAEGGTCEALELNGQSLAMSCLADRCAVQCDTDAQGDALCASVDESLACLDSPAAADEQLCLPPGSVPGGPCAAGDQCDEGLACRDARCLVQCSEGGDAQCSAVDSELVCASSVYDEPLCLPKGSFPGGPCAQGDVCAADLGGLDAADMFCLSGRCAVQCTDSGPFADGDALCNTVDSALTCVDSASSPYCAQSCNGGCPDGQSCLPSENACLPTGSFLGSPCADGTTCNGEPNLVCAPGDPATCAAGCDPQGSDPDGYCTTLGNQLGTGFDTCQSLSQDLAICVDSGS